MRLLLTSDGLSNPSIIKALKDLEPNPSFAFIPTAANLIAEDKDWLIKNLHDCSQVGPTDIVDIAALPKEVSLERLKAANVIVMGGGDTYDLMRAIHEKDLADDLKSLLKDRVYIGISAGSIATGPSIVTDALCERGEVVRDAPKGLGLANLYFVPHLNSKHFPHNTRENLKRLSKDIPGTVYALDDHSAIKIIDKQLEIISEGVWKRYD